MTLDYTNPLAKTPTRSELRAIELLAEARQKNAEGERPPEDWLWDEAWNIAAEFYKRTQCDGLLLYKALPRALPFHRCNSYIRLICGSNQSSKSTAAVAEMTRIARGWHPLYPKRQGIMLCVGLDLDHLAQNMWAMMTLPGQFEIVPDELTGQMRAVRPDPLDPAHIDPIDLKRKSLWVPAPPLLPQSDWDYKGGVAWEEAAKGCPRQVNIRSTGWKQLWHPSGGKPRRGIKLHAAWWDEEIANAQWFYETLPRLLRWKGRAVWSVTPQDDYVEALKLHQRAIGGDPDVDEFPLCVDDNPYIPDEEKLRLHTMLAALSDAELRSRYYGEWGALSRRIYPSFDISRLGVDGFSQAT